MIINLDYYEPENNLSSLTEPQLNKCINSCDLSLTSASLALFPNGEEYIHLKCMEREMNIKLNSQD